jgi:hypothetical protein
MKLCNYGASRDGNVDGRKSNSNCLRKEGCLFGALVFGFEAKY